MFIGVYEIDNKTYNYIYYKNSAGFDAWHRDTFSPLTKNINMLDFTIKGKTYQERKNNAEDIAKDWQMIFSQYSWSWGEVAEVSNYFEKIAKRYGLTKTFKENCII